MKGFHGYVRRKEGEGKVRRNRGKKEMSERGVSERRKKKGREKKRKGKIMNLYSANFILDFNHECINKSFA